MGPLTKFLIGKGAAKFLFVEKDGQCVTYPYWIFGCGVILNEDQKAQWERYILNHMEFTYWAMIVFFIIIITLFVMYSINILWLWPIALVFTGVFTGMYWIYYEITSRKILAGAKKTSLKFTFRDHIDKLAEVYSWRRIVFGTLVMVISNIFFIAIFSQYLYLAHAHSVDVELSRLIGWGITQILFLALFVLWAKVLIRKRQKRANSAESDQPASHR